MKHSYYFTGIQMCKPQKVCALSGWWREGIPTEHLTRKGGEGREGKRGPGGKRGPDLALAQPLGEQWVGTVSVGVFSRVGV